MFGVRKQLGIACLRRRFNEEHSRGIDHILRMGNDRGTKRITRELH